MFAPLPGDSRIVQGDRTVKQPRFIPDVQNRWTKSPNSSRASPGKNQAAAGDLLRGQNGSGRALSEFDAVPNGPGRVSKDNKLAV